MSQNEPDDLFEQAPLAYQELATSRVAALKRLTQFQADAAHYYRAHRNEDLGPAQRRNVSLLSAAIRRRLVSEYEVLECALARHSPQASEKFIQEVFWRGYFKGWLQQRPQVWYDYLADLSEILSSEAFVNGDLGKRYQQVIAGDSGIDCMDAWVQELPETGYLHNHARMWFASIWIFTLDLPWQLGAWFFYQHLLDGDPASNTLSWRWVGGLHTVGKHYLAKPGNISRYTQGRFNPAHRLVTNAEPLPSDGKPDPLPLEVCQPAPPAPCLLVITEEDCSPEQWMLAAKPAYIVGINPIVPNQTQWRSKMVQAAAAAAISDAVRRCGEHFGVDAAPALCSFADLPAIAQRVNVQHLLTAYAAIGPTLDALNEFERTLPATLELHREQRAFDQFVWPYAKSGFFGLKKRIPRLLRELSLVG
ncbi:MAG: FAD-binding domain-containing protein [Burkholderiaceae bacterium]